MSRGTSGRKTTRAKSARQQPPMDVLVLSQGAAEGTGLVAAHPWNREEY